MKLNYNPTRRCGEISNLSLDLLFAKTKHQSSRQMLQKMQQQEALNPKAYRFRGMQLAIPAGWAYRRDCGGHRLHLPKPRHQNGQEGKPILPLYRH